MTETGGQQLIIERILRDRHGIWEQIHEERDLRDLIRRMLVSSVISFAAFGLVLGSSNSVWQALTSMVKLPLLFLATLAICLPTLYLFNLVFGARLSMPQAVSLIMVAITVIAVLTLAFAPISLFFLLTAQSYAFFKLLNVCVLVLTALIGLRFLTAGMGALNAYQAAKPATTVAAGGPAEEWRPKELVLVGTPTAGTEGNGSAAAPDATPTGQTGAGTPATVAAAPPAATPAAVPAAAPAHEPGVRATVAYPAAAARTPATAYLPTAQHPMMQQRSTSMGLVYIWIVLFGFVGTQLAWTLRPFFGDPDQPFALFRQISGTFYSDVLQTLGRLLS